MQYADTQAPLAPRKTSFSVILIRFLSQLLRSPAAKACLLGLLLTSSLFKPMTLNWSPVDITLILCVSLTLCIVLRFFTGQITRVTTLAPLLLLFILFIPSLFLTTWTAYAAHKCLYFFTITLLATLAPYLLGINEKFIRSLFIFLATMGCVVALIGCFVLLSHHNLERLTVMGSSTIALGRIVGCSLLTILIYAIQSRLSLPLTSLLCALLLLILLCIGSIGPLFFFILVMAGLLILYDKNQRLYALKLALLPSLIFAGACLLLQDHIPRTSKIRTSDFINTISSLRLAQDNHYANLEQLRDDSLAIRFYAWKKGKQLILTYPQGIGLGGFEQYNVWPDAPRQFVHNIVLETFLEGNWAAGLCFMFLILFGLKNIWHYVQTNPDNPIPKCFLAVFVYLFLNDCVSGELNDSRLFMSLLGMAVLLNSGTMLVSEPATSQG